MDRPCPGVVGVTHSIVELEPSALFIALPDDERWRRIELAGAEYVETVTMPRDYPYIEYYLSDSRVKCRYRLNVT